MSRILVTGGTGHLGNVLIRTLTDRHENVRALVLPGEDTSSIDSLPVELVRGDVRDIESLRGAAENIDYVYHLAGIVTVSRGRNSILEEVNVNGTRNVLKVCKEKNIRRLVYTSSIHALNDVPHGITIDESIPITPEKALGSYGKSKAKATLEVLKAAREGLDVVVVCPSGVIGPFDYRPSPMGRMLLYFLRSPFRLVPVGAYNFVDVRDIADGEIRACEQGKSGEVYILSGEQTSIGDYGRSISFFTGKRPGIFYVPQWLCRIGAFFSDLFGRHSRLSPIYTPDAMAIIKSNCRICCEKAERQLGFRHRPLNDTVRDTVGWFRNRGVKTI